MCFDIGAGSTPLHYAAYGGNLKCCQARIALTLICNVPSSSSNLAIMLLFVQILLARGASRTTLNCNG